MTVARFLNAFVAPFFMGFCMSACAASGEPISSVILLISAGIFGYFSLPKGDEVIERIFDTIA